MHLTPSRNGCVGEEKLSSELSLPLSLIPILVQPSSEARRQMARCIKMVLEESVPDEKEEKDRYKSSLWRLL